MKNLPALSRPTHPDTLTGARAVPARSTSLGRRVVGHSGAFLLATLLRTGTVRGSVGGGVKRPVSTANFEPLQIDCEQISQLASPAGANSMNG